MNKAKFEDILKKTKNVINKIYKQYNKMLEWKYINVFIILMSVIMFVVGFIFKQQNMGVIAITILWLYNILYGLKNTKQRFLFIIINLMLFTFLIGRPFINVFNDEPGWEFSKNIEWKALLSILISEMFLLIGHRIAEKFECFKQHTKERDNNKRTIQKVLFIIFIVTAVASLYIEFVTYINLKDVDYLSVYTNQTIKFPFVIRIIATLFSYSVFAYLATMPSKKESLIVLTVYLLMGIPAFLLGSRNALILKILFAMIYIFIRHVLDENREIWISKKIKIITIIMIPLVIIFLGAYNYIRSDEEIPNSNPLSIFVDFFYKQGTTFYTVCQGFEHEDYLRKQSNVISYTLGDIIDYVIHNTISQQIFGTEDLESGNSIKMVELSNSMAHRLSYIVLGEESYLSGHGRGTSYIIEVYMDAGMIGVAFYNLILGMYLYSVINLLKTREFISRYIILSSLSQLFLLPRYSASGFMSFIVTPQFWIIPVLILGINVVTNIIKKEK